MKPEARFLKLSILLLKQRKLVDIIITIGFLNSNVCSIVTLCDFSCAGLAL